MANAMTGIALGMIETRGLVPAIEAADAMTKPVKPNRRTRPPRASSRPPHSGSKRRTAPGAISSCATRSALGPRRSRNGRSG